MTTSPKNQNTPSQVITHRHMQRIYKRNREKFDRHRAKGPAFATALDELEKHLFGEEQDVD